MNYLKGTFASKLHLTESMGQHQVLLSIDINCKKADEFLEKQEREDPENKLTYTYIVAKSIGNFMKEGVLDSALRCEVPVKIPRSIIMVVDAGG